MKKLLVMLLILTTFLFITSCDKDTPTDESSSETSAEESTTTEEAITGETEVVFADPRDTYYENVFWENEAQQLEKMSKIVYTDYQEFSEEIADKYVKLKENFNEKIFEDNYLLITHITFTVYNYEVYGYHDFVYNEENNTMSIIADIRAPRSDEAISPSSTTIYHINVIPKNMFPENVNNIPLEINIKANRVNYDFHQIECLEFNQNNLPEIIGAYNELLTFAQSYVSSEDQKSLLLSKIKEEELEDYFIVVMTPSNTQFLYDRAYRSLCIEGNNIAIFVDSIYGDREINESSKPKADFILVPREYYSDDMQDKCFYIYQEINNNGVIESSLVKADKNAQ